MTEPTANNQEAAPDLAEHVRDVPDFPKPGILFKDITTLLKNRHAFARSIDVLAERYRAMNIDKVVAVESRGFIFGGALAYAINAGFVPIRKAGKLPHKTRSETYELEYGTDTIEIHEDGIEKGDRVVVFDDVIATGGTLAAACRLVESLGGQIVEVAVVSQLTFIPGREKLGKVSFFTLIKH